MAFGISFGKNKTKVSQDTSINKNEATTQQQDSRQNQTQTGTTTTTGTQTGTQTGSTQQTQAGTSQQSQQATQQQSQTGTAFSEGILGALESLAARAMGTSLDSRGPQVERLNDFDSDTFVQGGVDAARSRVQSELESSINSLFDATGGTAGGNSMSALLANRLQGDAAANLAGVESGLVAQANEIERGNVLAGSQVQTANQGFVAQLLSALKGGVTTEAGTVASSQNTVGQTAQTSDQATAEQSQQQTAQTQQQTQELINVISQLLAGNTQTTGTESMTGTTSKKGGGFGLSI